MITLLNTEITKILDQTVAKVTVQFPITEIPADEDSVLKAIKDALTPAKVEEQAPTAKDTPTAGAPKQAPAAVNVK